MANDITPKMIFDGIDRVKAEMEKMEKRRFRLKVINDHLNVKDNEEYLTKKEKKKYEDIHVKDIVWYIGLFKSTFEESTRNFVELVGFYQTDIYNYNIMKFMIGMGVRMIQKIEVLILTAKNLANPTNKMYLENYAIPVFQNLLDVCKRKFPNRKVINPITGETMPNISNENYQKQTNQFAPPLDDDDDIPPPPDDIPPPPPLDDDVPPPPPSVTESKYEIPLPPSVTDSKYEIPPPPSNPYDSDDEFSLPEIITSATRQKKTKGGDIYDKKNIMLLLIILIIFMWNPVLPNILITKAITLLQNVVNNVVSSV